MTCFSVNVNSYCVVHRRQWKDNIYHIRNIEGDPPDVNAVGENQRVRWAIGALFVITLRKQIGSECKK